MLTRTGLSSARAFSNASSLHGNHSTGLCACWRRYGEVSSISLFVNSNCFVMIQLFHSSSKGQSPDENFVGMHRVTVYNRAYLHNKEEQQYDS